MRICGFIFAGSALFVLGCSSVAPSRKPLVQESEPYRIARLDEGRVTLNDGSELIFTVAQDGFMDVNGLPHRVQGLPAEKFLHLLHQEFPDAKEISIREFRPNRVTVLGEVFHQIHTELTDGPMRVMDAIAAANGFTPLANKRRVKLLRQNAGETLVYELDLRGMMLGLDLEQNLLLQPGDVITVPRNFL